MRFLADESCDFSVVRAVSEFQQRSVDEELMQLARRESRILLIEDKDLLRLAQYRDRVRMVIGGGRWGRLSACAGLAAPQMRAFLERSGRPERPPLAESQPHEAVTILREVQ